MSDKTNNKPDELDTKDPSTTFANKIEYLDPKKHTLTGNDIPNTVIAQGTVNNVRYWVVNHLGYYPEVYVAVTNDLIDKIADVIGYRKATIIRGSSKRVLNAIKQTATKIFQSERPVLEWLHKNDVQCQDLVDRLDDRDIVLMWAYNGFGDYNAPTVFIMKKQPGEKHHIRNVVKATKDAIKRSIEFDGTFDDNVDETENK